MLDPQPELIIFDYDGVLCNAGLYTPQAIREGLAAFGEAAGIAIAEPPEEALLATLGYPSHQTYPPFIPESHRHRWREMHEFTLDAMERAIRRLGAGVLYDGVPAMLEALVAEGRALALASNSSRRYQEAHRESAGLNLWFTHMLCAQTEGIESKSDMVVRILAAVGRRPAVMVGDRASDRVAAAAGDVPFVACSYGYGSELEWSGAVEVVDSIAALAEALGLRQGEVDGHLRGSPADPGG